MENKIRYFDIDHNVYWEGCIPISKLKDDIAILESSGATHISFECEEDYDLWTVKVEASSLRVETDEERDTRIKEEHASWGFLAYFK